MRARPGNGGMPWWYARPFSWLLFKGFLLTIAALAAASWVFISVTSSMSGLRDNNVSSAQLIRERNLTILVPPEWITGSASPWRLNDAEWRWETAEMKARGIVVFVLWVVGVSLLIWRYSRCARQARPATAFSIKL